MKHYPSTNANEIILKIKAIRLSLHVQVIGSRNASHISSDAHVRQYSNSRVLRGSARSGSTQDTNCYSGSFLCNSERFGHSKPYTNTAVSMHDEIYKTAGVFYLRHSFHVRWDPTSESCLVQQNRCPIIAMYGILLR